MLPIPYKSPSFAPDILLFSSPPPFLISAERVAMYHLVAMSFAFVIRGSKAYVRKK